MKEFKQRLTSLCVDKDIKPQQLRHYINVKSATITKWTKGELLPNASILKELSAYFNCSADYLLGLSDVEKITTLDELEKNIPLEAKQLLDKYHNLSSNNKSIVDYILKIGEEKTKPVREEVVIYKFPVYEQEAAAGVGIEGRDGKFTMYDIFTDDIPKNAVFGVHIRGNSMLNTDPSSKIEDVPDDAIVLLNPKVNDSDLDKAVVVVSINNEVICKQFLIEQDCIHFYSLNREDHACDDKFAKSPDDYQIIGQVVKVIKPTEYK